MKKMSVLIASPKTVFTVQDLAVLWGMPRDRKLYESIKYYVRVKKLNALRRGLYALSEDIRSFSVYELAQKMVPLSYVSLETGLSHHGISFQYKSSIESLAIVSKKITVQGQEFNYHQIKSEVLYNTSGLERNKEGTIASPERAVCDSLYLYPNISFDNLRMINKDKLIEISKIYSNASLEKRVKTIL